MQQTSDRNRKEADTDMENQLAVISGGVGIKNWGVGGTNYWVYECVRTQVLKGRTQGNDLNWCGRNIG